MKTITTIAAITAIAGAAHGQAFSEDFEGGLPAGWNVIDNAGEGIVWDTNVAWGDPNWATGDGMSFMVNSDTTPGEFDTELVTHSFVVPTGASLDLTANYQNFINSDFFNIDINDGSGWTNLLSWNEDHGTFKDVPGEDISLDLSAYGGSTVEVRFHYYDPNTGDWDWYIQIDNVTVTPAPSAMALLGLGGLIATRRRR